MYKEATPHNCQNHEAGGGGSRESGSPAKNMDRVAMINRLLNHFHVDDEPVVKCSPSLITNGIKGKVQTRGLSKL